MEAPPGLARSEGQKQNATNKPGLQDRVKPHLELRRHDIEMLRRADVYRGPDMQTGPMAKLTKDLRVPTNRQ